MLNKTVFERYSVSAQIHENDLSILYAGKDTQTSQVIFLTAIKSGIVPTADFLSRFKSMPQVNSALTLKPLDVGEADGQAVIVWEGVEGKSLANLTADGIGLPLERCLELARQLGSHLETLHNQKALQGVFLPEDVFLSDENALRILNLGIWNALSFKSAPTPYLAPELIRDEQASVRSDIYSLGALLYKILTGTAPDADPFPSRARSDIPTDWDELVSRCLNLDPARRVQSAAEFLGKLDEIGHATKLGQGKLMGMEDSLVGHTLGAYRLVERLGQGGMATVYKAYEAALDRYVAIKVLPQFFANDPTFAQRFRREAKAIAQLNHPNIVPIYSYGEDNGITYIAMQFIEGGTLKHASDQVYRSEDALRLLLPIARALGYAHKRGVIHRDIKPSNVLISDEGWPVLADFGLAQMAQASARLTESGVGMGTPTYMSPEQGQGDRVDQRTDIYSFGIMLYELVTGEAPFRADTPMAVVIKHLTAPMPLPSDVNPNVPPEVETLILKATAKNPDDRFQTAEELALAMERALNVPAVIQEEHKAEPSIPQYSATVVARPPVPTVAAHPPATPVAEPAAPVKESRKPRRIFRTMGIALLVLLGLPCLCVVGMYALNICPPEGPWEQPPWCAGSSYVAPFIDTPVVEMSPVPVTEAPPVTPVITEGELGNLLFQDDFEGGISPRWGFGADRYIVPWVADEFEGRTVFHSLPPTPPGEVSVAEIQEPTWDNYAIQFDFRFLKPDRFGTHYFSLRGRNAECSPTIRARQGYDITVSPDRSLLQKMICREGGHEELKTSDWDLDPNTWHTLQYNLIGNHIQLLIDGKIFIDYTDQQDWLTGSDLWLETGADAEVLFDNLKVYEIVPLNAPEPKVEMPPSESPLAKMCAPGQNVLYAEDFEDGEAQKWPTVQGSVAGNKPYGWSIVDDNGNKVLVEAKASSGGDEMAAFAADNFVWHAKFKVLGNDASMFFMWRISYPEDMRKRYVVVLGAHEKPFMIRFTDRATGASPTNVGSGTGRMLEQGRWYDIAISYFNGTHQVWYDGKKQIEYQDPEPFPPGTIGFETHLKETNTTQFFIDDMVICELSAPYEPYEIVPLGAIEDGAANQEPFSRAAGDWEATDLNDKSHMTMTIKRIETGQYTVLYIDELATFCDGGAGKAEFESGTFSNTATGTFEFVCDSSDRRINVEYKLTYSNVSDQIVDSYGIVWSRKK